MQSSYMFLFGSDMVLFGNNMFLCGNHMFLFGNDMFLFGNGMYLLSVSCAFYFASEYLPARAGPSGKWTAGGLPRGAVPKSLPRGAVVPGFPGSSGGNNKNKNTENFWRSGTGVKLRVDVNSPARRFTVASVRRDRRVP